MREKLEQIMMGMIKSFSIIATFHYIIIYEHALRLSILSREVNNEVAIFGILGLTWSCMGYYFFYKFKKLYFYKGWWLSLFIVSTLR